MRLIEANALLLHQRRAIMFYPSGEANEAVVTVAEINNAPTINAEPIVYGYWVKHPTFNYKICSVCSGGAPCDVDGSEWLSRRCPNCGAKMILED